MHLEKSLASNLLQQATRQVQDLLGQPYYPSCEDDIPAGCYAISRGGVCGNGAYLDLTANAAYPRDLLPLRGC